MGVRIAEWGKATALLQHMHDSGVACAACEIERLRAKVEGLENLREVAAMNCERLPFEVREALHQVPDIDKTHRCGMTKDA